jgi:hypothetical protein
MKNIPKEFITKIGDKEFVTYEGLLNLFHENGGNQIETKLIRTEIRDETFFIFKATVTGERGTYTGYGDACRANVSQMVVKHMMRMAETRAKARALRDYNNVGMCSVEEVD